MGAAQFGQSPRAAAFLLKTLSAMTGFFVLPQRGAKDTQRNAEAEQLERYDSNVRGGPDSYRGSPPLASPGSPCGLGSFETLHRKMKDFLFLPQSNAKDTQRNAKVIVIS